MRLQTDLSVILYYSNLTPNREKCQAAERKHILKKKKNHINNNKKIILALKYCFYFDLFFLLSVSEASLCVDCASSSCPHT